MTMSSLPYSKCEGNANFLQPCVTSDDSRPTLNQLRHSCTQPMQQRKRHLTVSIAKKGENDAKEPPAFLAEKLVGDVSIGVGVTVCVVPFLTVVDKAIVQRAAGSHSLWASGVESIRTIARHPIRYARSPAFLWMWGVYSTTYGTANALKTYTEQSSNQHQNSRSCHTKQGSNQTSSLGRRMDPRLAVFLGTSTVNTVGSLLKDQAYARMFGTVAERGVPKVSYGLWMARDFLVIGSSFILPDLVAKHWGEEYKHGAQATLPVAVQLIAGPLQLLGLDFYNRPLGGLTTRQAVIERVHFLRQGLSSVVSARIARIIPGYSVGGVLNTTLRDQWRGYLTRQPKSPFSTAAASLQQSI